MAKLDFNPQAYQYDQGLKAIELMLVAARQALDSRKDEVLQEVIEYRHRVDAGGDPIGGWDGPDRLWDHEDILRLEILALEEALIELNRAVAIAIYHHWERHVPNPKSKRRRNHDELVADLTLAGIELHPDIDALHFTANFLKHGASKWLQKLREGFPKEFPMLAGRYQPETISWGTLHLSESQIDWFFDIAKMSKRPILGAL